MPINRIKEDASLIDQFKEDEVNCPIQQGLANQNPDVDAIYRIIAKLQLDFNKSQSVALGQNAWCPFNSQNTTWFKEAFSLLYLPSYCSFRMTDIWSSFIAQRIAWANGWPVLFHQATMEQYRNEHNLLKDFEAEIPGYMNNERIGLLLSELNIPQGRYEVYEALRMCYAKLVEEGIFDQKELEVLEAWIKDLKDCA